jgi:ornithine cyclodeaminase/alanine dehydrogenase-like protein (mu-crystallin family)
MPILLSEQDVRIVLSMDDLIGVMETALIEFSSSRVAQPLRTVIEVGLQKAFFGVMPACIPEPQSASVRRQGSRTAAGPHRNLTEGGALGAKLVTVFGSNPAAGLPTHLATIVLLDSMTGELLAVMDGRYITEVRTAAVSALSVKLLAREGAGALAMIGSGVQARSHLDAIGRVQTLRSVRVWSPDADHRSAFGREMQPRTGATITLCASAQEALEGADIVVIATSAREPVVRSEWVADGAHVCAIGACRPDQREMDSALVSRARLFVDSKAAALAEAGDLLLARKDGPVTIAGELGELAGGIVEGRQSPDEVTIFKSLGMAVEDIAAAHLAYVKAAERGLGRGFVI